MTWSTPDLDLDSVLETAKRFDYEGVELRIGRGRHHGFETSQKHGVEINTDPPTRQAIRRKIAESGIIACCIATSCSYADPTQTEIQIDETIESIDLASDMGIATLRVFGGVLPQGVSREQAIDCVSSSLRSVADHAQQRNVIVCMETHDDWCHPDHVAQVMQRVDHSAIAVNWDIMHPVRSAGFSMDQSYEILKPWIKHVHFHDGTVQTEPLVMKPIGEGDIDHRRALERLIADGYDGFLSGEWIEWEPYETHLPRELQTMRRLEKAIS